MKQAQSALFFCVVLFLIIGAFGFGMRVRNSAIEPMQQANAVALQQAKRNQWTVEALGGDSSHTISMPTASAATQMADDVTGNDSTNDDLYGANSPLITFQQVYELLKEQYVNKISSDTPLAHGAVSAMIAALDDPNSRFLEAPERDAVDDQAKGIFAGVGIVFTVRKVTVDGLLERQLTIIDPVIGSPAEKAGLKTGDVITDIDGHWVVSFDPFAAQAKLFKSLSNDPVSFNHAVDATESKIKAGLTLPQAQTLLDTTQTTPVVLSILRNGQPVKVTLDGSGSTTVTDVESKLLPDGNGYIQFHAFTDSTAADFATAFAAVNSASGIVIDLRSCPGGSIDSALLIGQALAANQPMGSIVVRDNQGAYDKSAGFSVRTEPLAYQPTSAGVVSPIAYTGRLVVLVNDGTANTAEMFAAFLHDRLGARIVGTTTFGDGMAQTLFPMPDGSGFTLTTGLVKTTSDFAFEAKGITPDDVLAEPDTDGDAGLQHAEDTLSEKPLNASASALSASGQKT